MRIYVADLKDGDKLAQDAFNLHGLHVLSKGTALFEKEITLLLQHRVEYVDIDTSAAAVQQAPAKTDRPLEAELNPKWLTTMEPLYQEVVQGCEQLFKEAFQTGKIEQSAAAATFQPLLDNFKLERDVVSMLLLLNTKDDYTYQHSVQVGMLSYYLAYWLGYDEQEAVQIGQAGFLHDIGKCNITDDILNKPSQLSYEEFELIKKHPVHGHTILSNSIGPDSLAAIVALQHHERINGSGYPYGLRDNEIHPVSKIVAVADIYSAMISTRVYQQKRDLLYVLKELYKMSFTELDANTTHTFIKHMIPNFIGKRVELQSGEMGTIIMTHPSEFFRPLVQIDDTFIDLSQERSYEVKHVFM
ncbi:HD-GYP domain-containing protein [Paenibacillus sp. GCM10027626]|uniref:HD-GYP domain-containing protein n=1 Tax=Paenibacillus sp. GCM10027626 TaxID=3273411 RepID=UPI0036347129